MPLSPPGAAPLRVQAAAAASLLAEGVLPEDVGAAAGMANPAGGEYTPGVLADLADAIRRAAVSAAGALELDGASDATADAAWAEGDESIDYRDSENAPWWDPEALATLLCATHVADGAPGALRLRPKSQSLSTPFTSMSRFGGLMSRCATPFAWR